MSDISLGESGRASLKLVYDRTVGQGRVVPRLVFTLKAQGFVEGSWLIIDRLDAALFDGQELLGKGTVSEPRPIYCRAGAEDYLTLEIPVSRHALAFLATQARGDQINLTLEFWGLIYVANPSESRDLPLFPGDGWRRVGISKTGTTRLSIQIARSDWFTRVIQPLGVDQYIVTEIKVPDGPLQEVFQRALQHLESAERAYTTGDDPATFSYCRAAIDSLPGAKQNIFDNVADEAKRVKISALAKALGDYLHSGRHVAPEGHQQGDFPVDHRDAAYVLGSTRLLIAYTSQIVTGSP